MINSDISWLSEPNTHDLLMQLPLPLAIIGCDGNTRLLNRSFTERFDASCLKSESMQQLLRAPENDASLTVILPGSPDTSAVVARAVKIGENTILVLENIADTAFSTKLTDMQNRIIELEKLSATDQLTGAWNRAHFDKTISIELSRSQRYYQPLSLIFFEIDPFRKVSDQSVGDEILRELTDVISTNIRAPDMLYRWGGEKFVILAPSTSYQAAAALAETLRSKIEQHTIGGAGHFTISLGVTEHVCDESETTCLRRAEAALDAAKKSGRNRVVTDEQGSSDMWEGDQSNTILRLNWQDAYECGEPTIDQQHRMLFDLANTLIGAAFSRVENPDHFDASLQKLLEHVIQHFDDEEALLARHHYADLDNHKRTHKMLVAHAQQLREAAGKGDISISEVVDFLANDIVAQHILKTDREFYPLFK